MESRIRACRSRPPPTPADALTYARQHDYQAFHDPPAAMHQPGYSGVNSNDDESLSLAHPYADLDLHLYSDRGGRDVVADRVQRGERLQSHRPHVLYFFLPDYRTGFAPESRRPA